MVCCNAVGGELPPKGSAGKTSVDARLISVPIAGPYDRLNGAKTTREPAREVKPRPLCAFISYLPDAQAPRNYAAARLAIANPHDSEHRRRHKRETTRHYV